jgi:glycosyltransferase involved in cell wall biosynthesis
LASDRVDVEGVAARRCNFLFLGRIHRYKGVDVLLEAFSIASKRDPTLRLTIAGAGRIGSSAWGQIERLGVRVINQYLRDDEIREIVSSHGVMVLPYTSATQSGVAAIALGNGLPCIATDVGALPEQIVQGRNGIIVPSRDAKALAAAMREIASDSGAARLMAAESVRLARNQFAWEKIGGKLVADLSHFVSTWRRPTRLASA